MSRSEATRATALALRARAPLGFLVRAPLGFLVRAPLGLLGLALVVLAASCAPGSSTTTDGAVSAPPDLTAPSLESPDLSVGPDESPDLAAPGIDHTTQDLSAPRDFSPPPDFAPSPDLAPPRDVTFYVVADTHADPPVDSYDLRATARVINAVAKNGQWPASIGGAATGFTGGAIAPPRGVVFVGDLTGWGTAPTEIQTFRHYFEKGNSADSIEYPAYLGLGNHDIDPADRAQPLADAYRAQYWAWIDAQHSGAGARVPVGSYDAASHAYSWDFAGVHFVQLHRQPNDDDWGMTPAMPFLRGDLTAHAADGRPVFLFHHYAMDAFGTEDRWWTEADRAGYRSALAGYHVSAIFAGHSHFAMQYEWQGARVFQANNAKAEINTGNNDGNGSFAIVRLTAQRLDVVTCRWLDDQGHYELIAPFYSGPADPGPLSP